MKPKFIMLIGIPASGKDTWAEEYLKKNPEVEMFSSDKIREELYGDERIQGQPQEVFQRMQSRTVQSLKIGKSVIYNATNVSYKDRKSIISMVKDISEVSGVIFATPLAVCKRRNALRARQVPNYVFDKMIRRWQTPCYWEGFSTLEVVHNYDAEDREYIENYVIESIDFKQQNHHHSLTLFGHSQKAMEYIQNRYPRHFKLARAAFYHDLGKLRTKSEPDENGDCHYYNHENFSSYITLCCGFLYDSQYITYHMIPYMRDAKSLETWRKRMGEDFWEHLMILHKADVEAH